MDIIRKHIFILLATILISLSNFAFAETFSSQNFKIFDESVNIGVEGSSSQNFKIQNSAGEIAPGPTQSQNFYSKGGFFQRIESLTEDQNQQNQNQGGNGGVVPLSFLASSNPDTIPPQLQNIDIVPIDSQSIRITFKTDELSKVEAFYGRTLNFELGSIKDNAFSENHAFFITNLKPETIYFIKLKFSDQSNNEAISDVFQIKTSPDTQAPANVSNLRIFVRDRALLLKWQNPPDEDFSKVIIVRKVGAFAQTISEGEVIFEGLSEQFLDQNLKNDETYFYTLFAADGYGNLSSGTIIKGVPKPLIPKPESVKPTETIKPPEVSQPEIPEIEEEQTIEKPEDLFSSQYLPKVVPPPSDQLKPKQINLPASEAPEIPTTPPAPAPIELPYLFKNFEILLKTVSGFVNLTQIIKESAAKERIVPTEITVIKDSVITFSIAKEKLSKPARSIVVTLNNSAYLLSYSKEKQSYSASIQTPVQKGKYPFEVLIIYEDDTAERIKSEMLVDPYGYVYEKIDDQELRLKSATVTLYVFNQEKKVFEFWQAKDFNQTNPQITNDQGEFSFFVPGGKYYLTAYKEGYEFFKTAPFEVKEKIVNKNIELKKISKKFGFLPEIQFANIIPFLPFIILFSGVIILAAFIWMIRHIFKH